MENEPKLEQGDMDVVDSTLIGPSFPVLDAMSLSFEDFFCQTFRNQDWKNRPVCQDKNNLTDSCDFLPK
jgi:hypothetical protein